MLQLSERALAEIESCVHCGLCVEACPTYRELRVEGDSPRGRIHLIRSLVQGLAEPNEALLAHLDRCLACRACETACPSGVRYGAIIEDARAALETRRRRSLAASTARRFFFRGLLPRPRRLRAMARILRLLQRTGVDRLARRTGLLPEPMAAFAEVVQVPDRFGQNVLPERIAPAGECRYRVALLTGCVMDVLFGPTNVATARVLARNGCEVLVPREQVCCGAVPLHAGDREAARQMARRNIDVFLATGADYIIVNAAGCGSTLKEYPWLLAGDPAYAEKARQLAAKVKDVTEFLAEIDLVPPKGPVEADVVYQDACHLAHAQGIRIQPRQVLQKIPGLRLRALADAGACCGSAGIYNLVQYDLSMQVLDRKMEAIAAARPEIIVSANPGCILQLRLGVKRFGLKAEVLHVVDLLDRAYQAAEVREGERQWIRHS
ncbi:MAG TPA: heterodisulfide reductase-related iron-sulfur binding cluster [Symbiobacteriaceae bacterium]